MFTSKEKRDKSQNRDPSPLESKWRRVFTCVGLVYNAEVVVLQGVTLSTLEAVIRPISITTVT